VKTCLWRRTQLRLPRQAVDALVQVATFVVMVYVEAWFTAPKSVDAPRSDLRTLKKLVDYKKVNKRVATCAIGRFSLHLWYLTERYIGITVFDESLPSSEREKIVGALCNREGEDDPPRKRSVHFSDVPNMSISDLVTKHSMGFFNVLGLKTDFLSHPITEWGSQEDYQEGKKVVTSELSMTQGSVQLNFSKA